MLKNIHHFEMASCWWLWSCRTLAGYQKEEIFSTFVISSNHCLAGNSRFGYCCGNFLSTLGDFYLYFLLYIRITHSPRVYCCCYFYFLHGKSLDERFTSLKCIFFMIFFLPKLNTHFSCSPLPTPMKAHGSVIFDNEASLFWYFGYFTLAHVPERCFPT